ITNEDLQFAVDKWNISPSKCSELPFGVEMPGAPQDRKEAGKLLREKHGIEADEKILLFNGLLNYKPNLDALNAILNHINPLLQKNNSFKYRILVCGKGLPENMNNLSSYTKQKIIHA